jgi:hypothetical protein
MSNFQGTESRSGRISMPTNRVVFSVFSYPAGHALAAFVLMGLQGLLLSRHERGGRMRLMQRKQVHRALLEWLRPELEDETLQHWQHKLAAYCQQPQEAIEASGEEIFAGLARVTAQALILKNRLLQS